MQIKFWCFITLLIIFHMNDECFPEALAIPEGIHWSLTGASNVNFLWCHTTQNNPRYSKEPSHRFQKSSEILEYTGLGVETQGESANLRLVLEFLQSYKIHISFCTGLDTPPPIEALWIAPSIAYTTNNDRKSIICESIARRV